MAKKDETHAHTDAAAPLPPSAPDIMPPPEQAAAPAAESAAAPAAPAASAAPAGHDFDITLKNNDNPDQTQTVVAHGPDGGLAAQKAMREHPGWTADHSRTHEHAPSSSEHSEIHDTTHAAR